MKLQAFRQGTVGNSYHASCIVSGVLTGILNYPEYVCMQQNEVAAVLTQVILCSGRKPVLGNLVLFGHSSCMFLVEAK
jgi:hypothetical protein